MVVLTVTIKENCAMIDKNEELVSWCRARIGRGSKPFLNARRWSLEAGLHAHAVNQVLETSRASAITLVKLAEASGDDVLEVLIVGRYLRPEHVPLSELTPNEQKCLRAFRQIPEAVQSAAIGVLEGLNSQNMDSESSSQEAVPDNRH